MRLRKHICSFMLSTLLLTHGISFALPVNPHDTANISNIAESSNVMDITGADNALIKWEDFSVGAAETVNFAGMDKMLNFVDGQGNPSHIMGNINAPNVDLFILNPSGVIFGKDSSVNTGSLHASTNLLTEEMQEQYLTNGINPLNSVTNAEDLMGDVAFLNEVQADKLEVRGRNISILNTSKLDISSSDIRVPENGHVDTPTGEDISNFQGKYLDGTTDASINRNDFTVISSEDELQNLNPDGHYMMNGNDLTLSDSWTGIKNTSNNAITFTGVLNGMGTTISGLNGEEGFFSKDSTLSGEFRNFDFKDNSPTFSGGRTFIADYVKDATISNIRNLGEGTLTFNGTHSYRPSGMFGKVENSSFYSVTNEADMTNTDNFYFGGIIAYTTGSSDVTLTNVHNKGNLTSENSRTGGLIGDGSKIVITHSSNSGNITNASGDTGGFVGIASRLTVTDSENNGKISSSYVAGGIAGKADDVHIENVNNNVDIEGGSSSSTGLNIGGTGGLIGWLGSYPSNPTYDNGIKNVSNNGKINGLQSHNGGIIGSYNCSPDSTLTVSNAVNKGEIIGSGDGDGGIIGWNNRSTLEIKDSKNLSDVSGTSNIGGIIGNSGGATTIDNASNSANISGTYNYVGGLIGASPSSVLKIENSSNTGNISADKTCAGGYIGKLYTSVELMNKKTFPEQMKNRIEIRPYLNNCIYFDSKNEKDNEIIWKHGKFNKKNSLIKSTHKETEQHIKDSKNIYSIISDIIRENGFKDLDKQMDLNYIIQSCNFSPTVDYLLVTCKTR